MSAERVQGFFQRYLRHTKDSFYGKPFLLERWQQDFIQELYRTDKQGKRLYNRALFGIPRKNGKALDVDTPIPTPDGWKAMGSLRVGDQVFDEQGKPTNVIRTTDVMYGHECFLVRFSDGTSVVADADHLWTAHDRWRDRTLTQTTKEMANDYDLSRNGKVERRYRVPVAGALVLPDADLPLDPYLLGQWLGDGTSSGGGITTADEEVWDYIRQEWKLGRPFKKSAATTRTVLGLKVLLRELGVLDNKHVPESYLRASERQRRELLQGLMDSDGDSASNGGGTSSQVEFANVNRRLAEGVLELARSLGLKPVLKVKRATCNGKDCGEYYRVAFTAYREDEVFKLNRKRGNLKPRPAKATRASYRQIVEITPVESVPVKCIEVDTPSSLYLCGFGMVPTHNSSVAAGLGLYELGPALVNSAEVICASGTRDLASLVFDQAKDFVAANPKLRRLFDPRQYEILSPKNQGVLKKISGDGPGAHGLNPSFIVMDELHGFTTPRQRELYSAMVTSTGARTDPLIVSITTAGYDPQSLLGQLYLNSLKLPDIEYSPEYERLGAGLIIARDSDNGYLFYWFGCSDEADVEDPAVWAAANPASWIKEEELRKQLQSPDISEESFRRLRLNQWTSASESWFAWGEWEALQDDRMEMGDEIVIGLDIALYHDTAAVSWVSYDDPKYLLDSYVWSPSPDLPAHEYCPGGKVDLCRVREFILELAEKHRVRAIYFDPTYFNESAEILSEEGLNLVVLNQASAPMGLAYSRFWAAVKEQRIIHNGNEVLSANIENTNAKMTDRGWKVSKVHQNRKIDATVASAMALFGANEYLTTEVRGLIDLSQYRS